MFDVTGARIPARSRRQAMDWSLVLISQGIENAIDYAEDSRNWSLLVSEADSTKALAAIRQYRLENRRWGWRQPLSKPGLIFDWCSLTWVLLLAVFFWLSGSVSGFKEAGVMDTTAVLRGEWWRLFTAVWLHADLGHFASNASIGFVLMGLAMGAYGTGTGLLAACLAGVGGNLAALLFSPRPHLSLGASGVVMGALGLLAAHSVATRRHVHRAPRIIITGLMAGLMLFVLLGLSPGTDIVAHLGGFVSGILFGAVMGFFSSVAQRVWPNLVSGFLFLLLAVVPWLLAFTSQAAPAMESRGAQFISFTQFGGFEENVGQHETVLISPLVTTRIQWNELVASWNTDCPPGTWLKIEARAVYPQGATKYYTLGEWSPDPLLHPRRSLRNQKDAQGDVATDTLVLVQRSQRLQCRITLGTEERSKPRLRFLGFCLKNTAEVPARLPPNGAAWGRTLDVPERSQMDYPGGHALCSPTTLSMILGFWAKQLHQPKLDVGVPEICGAVYDSAWPGVGNWSFNAAFAGSLPGMRAYVARFTDVSELEDWIVRGIPVGLSVCYNRLRGIDGEPSGHLVVCVGFSPDGDPILNDPGTSRNVRKVFRRENFINAWAYSKNTVYLVYPVSAATPLDRFGHWQSESSPSE